MSHDSDLSRRSFLKATGGAAAAATVAGCLTGDPDQSEPESGTLNLINSTMGTVDPIASDDTASGRVVQQVHDGLMNYPNGELEVEQLLASGYDVSDDYLTYTFDLKDAQFHNGDDVTASDFVYSFERLAASENSARSRFILSVLNIDHETDGEGNYQAGSLAVEAPDDSTLEITLAAPFASALSMLAYSSFAVVPEGIVGDVEGYDGEMEYEEFAQNDPVGAGPFEFDTWEPDAEAQVTWFEDYHGETPGVETVHWQILEDDSARFTYAMEQSADVFELPTAEYDPDLVSVEEEDDAGRSLGTYGPMENDETAQYVGVSSVSTFYFAFNTEAVPLSVRRAIAYVTDHEQVIQDIFKGRGEEAFHFTPPAIYPNGADEYRSHAEDWPYSPNETDRESARQVLEADGYTEDDPFDLTLTTYQSDTFQELGRLTRDKLSGLGITMEIQKEPFATLQSRGESGELEMYSLGWIMDWPEADNFMYVMDPSKTITGPDHGGGTYINWQGTDAAERAQEAWNSIDENSAPTEEDQQLRNEAYVTMEEAMWDDMVMLTLFHQFDERFHYDYVDIDPMGAGGFSRMKLNGVTLDQE